jgi:hypothetical protein
MFALSSWSEETMTQMMTTGDNDNDNGMDRTKVTTWTAKQQEQQRVTLRSISKVRPIPETASTGSGARKT